MKKLAIISTMVFMAIHCFAGKKDSSYLEARKSGALARIQIQVCDDSGENVPNADIRVFMGMNFRPKGYYLEGKTDTNGVFVAEGKTCGDEISIDVIKDGYYSSSKKLSFAKMGFERNVENDKWQPFGEVQNIVLRKKINPINLISFSKLIDVVQTNRWVGFDMKKGDFVAPMGCGKNADFEVKVEWDGHPAWESRYCCAEIRFPNPFTGGYYARNVSESKFPTVYKANPVNPYKETHIQIIDRNGNPHTTRLAFTNDASFVVRVRSVLDEVGNIKMANYGNITRINIGPSRRGVALLRLEYVFNPTLNDTNLEPRR